MYTTHRFYLKCGSEHTCCIDEYEECLDEQEPAPRQWWLSSELEEEWRTPGRVPHLQHREGASLKWAPQLKHRRWNQNKYVRRHENVWNTWKLRANQNLQLLPTTNKLDCGYQKSWTSIKRQNRSPPSPLWNTCLLWCLTSSSKAWISRASYPWIRHK